MLWSKIRISVNDIVAFKHIRLQSTFEALFIAMLAPRDAAMFDNRDIAEDYTFYFSPGCSLFFSSVLSALGAVECPPPSRDSVVLLAGHATAREDLLRS